MTLVRLKSSCFLIGCLSLSKLQYGKNKGDPKEGREGGNKSTEDKSSGTCGGESEGALVTCAPPSPAPQTPPGGDEVIKRIVEVGWLEGVGRLT